MAVQMKAMEFMQRNQLEYLGVVVNRANEILRTLERKTTVKNKEEKKVVTGQLDMYNYKLAEIAHEIDKMNLNELTPIDALNILSRIKEKMK